ncbi:terminase [Secundilactobacillus pentosiphilus]|uniref:Terminase n=1 Tax=Secundilactobacillus pentosiphilus TaxID=1714682 RepID=A0A1Z5IUK0_9LACO|nr:terminase small subunit [Secundilactobacillus pentosiphilus]GAX05444.1 terminase [Secundilactobacillus pentosiphilus]
MTKKADEAKADYLAGKSYKEIATQYGVSEGTVRAWKSRYKWDGSAPHKKSATKSATQHKNVATKTQHVAVQQLADNHELTEKQKLFCLYYLQRFNATWAYQKAYECNYNTAHTNGPALLANTGIKEALSKLRKEQQQDLYINANDILKEYIKQATASLGDVLNYDSYEEVVTDKDGKPMFDQDNKLERYHRVDIHLRPADEVDWSLIEDVHVGRDGLVVKLYDKQKAMKELLDRLPEPQTTDDTDDAFLNAIVKANKTKDEDEDEDTTV